MEDITSAYKRICRANPSKANRKKIDEAYKVLGDPIKRYKYDGPIMDEPRTWAPPPPKREPSHPSSQAAIVRANGNNPTQITPPPVQHPSMAQPITVPPVSFEGVPWDDVEYVVVREKITIWREDE
jgi:hypothetical protein